MRRTIRGVHRAPTHERRHRIWRQRKPKKRSMFLGMPGEDVFLHNRWQGSSSWASFGLHGSCSVLGFRARVFVRSFMRMDAQRLGCGRFSDFFGRSSGCSTFTPGSSFTACLTFRPGSSDPLASLGTSTFRSGSTFAAAPSTSTAYRKAPHHSFRNAARNAAPQHDF